jgi:hypothetical protein
VADDRIIEGTMAGGWHEVAELQGSGTVGGPG